MQLFKLINHNSPLLYAGNQYLKDLIEKMQERRNLPPLRSPASMQVTRTHTCCSWTAKPTAVEQPTGNQPVWPETAAHSVVRLPDSILDTPAALAGWATTADLPAGCRLPLLWLLWTIHVPAANLLPKRCWEQCAFAFFLQYVKDHQGRLSASPWV